MSELLAIPPTFGPLRMIPANPLGVFLYRAVSSHVSLLRIGSLWFSPANMTGPFPGTARRILVRTQAPAGIATRSPSVMSMTGIPPDCMICAEISLRSEGRKQRSCVVDISFLWYGSFCTNVCETLVL